MYSLADAGNDEDTDTQRFGTQKAATVVMENGGTSWAPGSATPAAFHQNCLLVQRSTALPQIPYVRLVLARIDRVRAMRSPAPEPTHPAHAAHWHGASRPA